MKSESLLNSELNTDNKGFSIVELIVAVAILAAVFTPVLRSFTTAGITNAKAQTIQNGTSAAEKIMEEIKGSSIGEIYKEATDAPSPRKDDILFLSGGDASDFLSGGSYTSDSSDYDNPPYVVIYKNVTATQGKTYDIRVKIDAEPYDQAGTDASNINGAALPQLYDIQDSKDHVVLSWEMSKYDTNAINNLAEENAKTDAEKDTIKTFISNGNIKPIKTTKITFTDSGSNAVDVKCDVTYETGNASYPKTITYNVYSGHLDNIPVNEKSNGGPHAYLFYVMSAFNNVEYIPHEVINVVDNTSSGVHNVYLMLQNDSANHLSDLKYSDGSKTADIELKYNNVQLAGRNNISSYMLSKSHWDKDDMNDLGIVTNNAFYTNLTGNNIEQGKLFDIKKKNRVYEVIVSVYDGSSLVTELTSSMNTGDEAK